MEGKPHWKILGPRSVCVGEAERVRPKRRNASGRVQTRSADGQGRREACGFQFSPGYSGISDSIWGLWRRCRADSKGGINTQCELNSFLGRGRWYYGEAPSNE